jgi:glycosyltransferase involved in cell wall biosynthesis
MHIFYWSPFISKVATVSSVIRSAESIAIYSKGKAEVSLIDAMGEWQEYKKKIHSKINIIKLNKNDYYNYLFRGGYIKSRLSYLIIFFLNFNKLKNLINNKKPNFLIIHLMTSLPIFLTLFFKSDTKIILRISGLPKLNILRYFFWKFFSKRIYKVTCPTVGTYNNLLKKGIFDKNKLCVLRDPALKLKEFAKKKFEKIENSKIKDKKYIIGIGRLTKQKNFNLLINGFNQIKKKYHEYELIIIGEGEKKDELLKLIKSHGLEKEVHLLGFKNNVYKYLKRADCFILTSLWEDPGFVLIEAGLSNTTVISSDCKNGPEEILGNGKNGYLFKNNNLNDLLKKFNEFKKEDKIKLLSKKLNLKKELKKFTFFAHFNSLKKIINLKY